MGDYPPQYYSPRARKYYRKRPSVAGGGGAGGAVGGWKELGRTTLGSAGDNINISSLATKRYNMFLVNTFDTGATEQTIRLGNGSLDTGTNYAGRGSFNGTADGTQTSDTYMRTALTGIIDQDFCVGYLTNYATKEKLLISHWVSEGDAEGSATPPHRGQKVGKWSNTSNAFDNIGVFNRTSGNFDTGSEIVVLGYDPADTHTDNFWEELADVSWTSGKNISTGTFTPKTYLWLQGWITKTGTTSGSVYLRTGNSSVDTGSNYAHRYSINGVSDGTQTSNSYGWFLDQGSSGGTKQWFFNAFFINNASNEKLGIIHENWVNNKGSAYASGRTEHAVKWANTSNQINIFDVNGLSISDFTGGQIKVWGAD